MTMFTGPGAVLRERHLAHHLGIREVESRLARESVGTSCRGSANSDTTWAATLPRSHQDLVAAEGSLMKLVDTGSGAARPRLTGESNMRIQWDRQTVDR